MRKAIEDTRRRFFRMFYGKTHDSSRQHYYEKILNNYQRAEDYLDLLMKRYATTNLKTNQKIGLSNTFTFDSELDVTKKALPSSCYMIKSKPPLFCNRLIYKTLLGKYKTKLDLHFFENKLFFYNYTFSDLLDNEREEIVDIIANKYLSKSIKLSDLVVFNDDFNNYIIIENNMNLTVKYLSLNSNFFASLEQLENKEETLKKVRIKKLYALL